MKTPRNFRLSEARTTFPFISNVKLEALFTLFFVPASIKLVFASFIFKELAENHALSSRMVSSSRALSADNPASSGEAESI